MGSGGIRIRLFLSGVAVRRICFNSALIVAGVVLITTLIGVACKYS